MQKVKFRNNFVLGKKKTKISDPLNRYQARASQWKKSHCQDKDDPNKSRMQRAWQALEEKVQGNFLNGSLSTELSEFGF